MESRLQNGTFIYKTGFLITKCVFHLQNGILALQTGISFCNSSTIYQIDGIPTTFLNIESKKMNEICKKINLKN